MPKHVQQRGQFPWRAACAGARRIIQGWWAMSRGAEIVSAARECIGTPFVHQGRQKGVGLDCVGLVRYPAEKLGLDVGDYDGYSRQPDPLLMGDLLRANLDEVDEPEIGDILWFAFNDLPMHLAIYAGDTVIHALSFGPQCVTEHIFAAPWPDQVRAVFRYRD